MRELLEMAARAAGLRISWLPASPGRRAMYWLEDVGEWDPITSDADAFRLAVKLYMRVDIWPDWSEAYANGCEDGAEEESGTDPYAATRLAITRAAAEIGKSMGDEK